MIESYDSLRFLVPSRNGRGEYLVDIGAYEGNGSCNCKHFEIRMEPKLKLGSYSRALRCKHILAARAFFVDAVIKHLSDEAKKANQSNQRQTPVRVDPVPEAEGTISEG